MTICQGITSETRTMYEQLMHRVHSPGTSYLKLKLEICSALWIRSHSLVTISKHLILSVAILWSLGRQHLLLWLPIDCLTSANKDAQHWCCQQDLVSETAGRSQVWYPYVVLLALICMQRLVIATAAAKKLGDRKRTLGLLDHVDRFEKKAFTLIYDWARFQSY